MGRLIHYRPSRIFRIYPPSLFVLLRISQGRTARGISRGLARLSIRNFTLLEEYRRRVSKCAPLQRILQTSMPELAELELEYVPLANMGIREILSPKLQPLSISTLPGSRRIGFDWM